MASGTVVNSALILTLDAGVNEDGKPVYKRKSFRNIKTLATYDQLFNVANALAPLQQYPLESVERDNSIMISAE
ncbi:uncharacterized protein DUF1659 [Scopulibacillus darangshiensis]|uniref:Uncharacterized protein DUF1659 n=1 Tax=Scopulibacillus darangshiensis TaxID=442528 RepID=A0A4R2P4M2_9BACL|nr:DUF1659 domain-containing protein [Scopulibacillus darangshiensis]TCP29769.1 uncharacterized protein DUF1659 [Scopulibacillus darangshiensis]